MSNGNKTLRRFDRTEINKPLDPALLAGYRDAYNRQPFCQEYERAPAQWQRDYENGRLIAVNIRTAGFDIKPRFRVLGRNFVRAYTDSHRLIGSAHDLKINPPTK